MADPPPNRDDIRRIYWKRVIWGFFLTVVVVYAGWPRWSARVVDMIPRSLQFEDWQNSEPTLAVDPTNPSRMAASAMFLGSEGIECGPLEAGVVASTNKGKNWVLSCVLPVEGDPDDDYPDWAGDHSFDVVGSGSKTYAVYLTPAWDLFARLLESNTGGGLPAPPTILGEFKETDQPQITGNPSASSDEYALSANVGESTSGCASDGVRDAVVYAGSGAPSLPTCFQQRPAASENTAVRSAWNSNGTLYSVYYRVVNWDKRFADVVIEKGTKGASGTVTFGSIVDAPIETGADECTSRDGLSGYRLARCVVFPWYPNDAFDSDFGQERRTLSQLAIAVHPNDANVVYVAWGDSTPGEPSQLTLHLRASTDGGVTWDTADRYTVTDATNPALAINNEGEVAFAFQQLTLIDGVQWWQTMCVIGSPGFGAKTPYTLAKTKADVPLSVIMPYIGDYIDLLSVGREFYGVFSANNAFGSSVFPEGVTFERKPPGSFLYLGYGATVQVSIDPYFFAIERQSRLKGFLALAQKKFHVF